MNLKGKFILLLLAATFLNNLSYCQQEAVIIGVVRDAGTKEKLTGVNIVLDDTTGTVTDSSGKYQLTTAEGSHSLMYRFIGYKIVSKNVLLKTGDAMIINIDLLPSSKELGTVVVSASRFEQRIEDVTVSMEVLKPDFVQNTNTIAMDDAINQVPGIAMIDGQANIRGGSGFSYGAGSRVLVLVDDLPMLSADANDAKWTFLPTENLEQIEIIKGASSALYGSSAMNGVINIRTAYPKAQPETKAIVFSSIYDSPKREAYKWWGDETQMISGFSASHSRKIGNLDLVVAANGLKDDGFRQGEKEERYRANFNTRYTFSNKLSGLSAGLNGNIMRTTGGLFLLWQDDSTGAYIPQGGLDSGTTISNYTTIRKSIDPFVTYVGKDGSVQKLRTRYFNTDNKNNTQQESFASVYYAEYQYQKKFNETFTWTSGVVESYSDVNSELYGYHATNNIALYTQADNTVDKWIFSFGIRWEHNRIDTVVTGFTPVFRSGINYELLPYTHLRVSYGQGYRYPSIAEKFIKTRVGNIVIYPNDSIKAETGWTTEFGVNQGFKVSEWKGQLDAAIFWSEYQNMMEFTFGFYGKPFIDPLFGAGFQSLNIGNTRIKGIDITLTGEGNIGKFPVTLLCGYTYIDPVQIDFNPAVDTLKNSAGYNILKYRYRHLFKGNAEISYRKFTFGISARFNSFMENVDKVFEILIPGVQHYRELHKYGDWVFDSRIIFQITKNVDVSFITKNVFNHEYMGRPADLQPPRTFTLQGRVKF